MTNALQRVEDTFTCWACGETKGYYRLLRPAALSINRCEDCAKRDGDLRLSDWWDIARSADPVLAYRKALVARDARHAANNPQPETEPDEVV